MRGAVNDAQNSSKQRSQQGPGRPWKPGQSGNPGGRPKESKTFKAWCREAMERLGRDAILRIACTARDERVRLNAWRLITEYAYGRPADTEREIEPVSQDHDAGVVRVARMIDRMAERLRAHDEAERMKAHEAGPQNGAGPLTRGLAP